MSIAETILAEVCHEAEITKRVLDRVPGDKLAWRPHPKSFSLGQLALHIAVAPGAVAEAAVPDSMEAPAFAQPQPANVQEIQEAFLKGLEKIRSALGPMDDRYISSEWRLARNGATVLSMPRVTFIRSIMMNHIYHHRGQLSVYLRLLDVPVPSIYGPSADDNPFA